MHKFFSLFFKRVRQAIRFTFAYAKHIRNHSLKTTRTEWVARVRICAACENCDSNNDECTLCNCRITIKANWKDQHCPINKW